MLEDTYLICVIMWEEKILVHLFCSSSGEYILLSPMISGIILVARGPSVAITHDCTNICHE